MELQQLLNLVEKMTPWGVATLAIIFILKPLMPIIGDWLRGKLNNNNLQLNEINNNVQLLGSNHLHEVKDSLNRMEGILQNMNDNITYIKARVNGK